MSYAIMRFAKVKAGGIAARDRHNERKKQQYKSNPDIDPDYKHLNYHLIDPAGKTYKKLVDERVAEVGCKTRRDSVMMVETLVTASPKFFIERDSAEYRRFFTLAVDFISERIGKDNIISAAIHMDEATPHMHLSFVPVTKDGRLSAKDLLGGPRQLSKWQDDFHAFMVNHYPELQRGVSAMQTQRKHMPVWLFKQADRLELEYGKVLQALGDITRINAPKKRDEAMKILTDWLPQAQKLTASVKMVDEEMGRLVADSLSARTEMGYQRDRANSIGVQFRDMENKKDSEIRSLKQTIHQQERLLKKVPKEVMEQIERQRRTRELDWSR
jgi:hypothetical protein